MTLRRNVVVGAGVATPAIAAWQFKQYFSRRGSSRMAQRLLGRLKTTKRDYHKSRIEPGPALIHLQSGLGQLYNITPTLWWPHRLRAMTYLLWLDNTLIRRLEHTVNSATPWE